LGVTGRTDIFEARKMADKIPKRITNMAKSPDLKVTVRVGKEGLKDSLIEEINDQLKSKEIIKLKLNKGTTKDRDGKKGLVKIVEQETNSKSVFVRGNIAVFWRT